MSFQRLKIWKQSNDPEFEAKKNRVLEVYAIAHGKSEAGPEEPDEVICMDELGPLNLQPHPGRQWACRGGRGHVRRRRRRATFTRPLGVRHLFAAYDLKADKLYGQVRARKRRGAFLTFMRYICSLHPPDKRIAVVLDNFSAHLTIKTDTRVGEYAPLPTSSSSTFRSTPAG